MNYHHMTSWNPGSQGYMAPVNRTNEVSCNWNVLCDQLLQQWKELTFSELEQTGHMRDKIAGLINHKYGIPPEMAENYLRNFERTLPTLGVQASPSAGF